MTRLGSMDPAEQKHNFFFYGTLMVPAILERVLRHPTDHLTFEDAILPGFTRHCVKGQDYPAVTSVEQSHELMASTGPLDARDMDTRGTLVKGLSLKDIRPLDLFEDIEYTRVMTTVHVLGPSTVLQSQPKHWTGVSRSEEAWVYIWNESLSLLDPKIWSFEDFLRDKAHLWTGSETSEFFEDSAKYHNPNAAVQDSASEVIIAGQKVEGYPDFGHGMLKFWLFPRELTYLNNGSYGATPIPVIEATKRLHEQIEQFPDLFMRRSWLPLLNNSRSQVAKIINAKYDEVVIVKNTTMGISTVTDNIDWQDGDVIVIYDTTYGAMSQMMKCVCDRHPKVNLEIIKVTQPCSHASVVKQTEEVLAKYNEAVHQNPSDARAPKDKRQGQRVRLLLIDSIASNPGVVMPWEDVVGLCHKYGVLSLVDAAHSIGQQKLDVKRSDPDFLATNCHKWLMSHRGSAVFYVPLRNQHLIRSSNPTSAGYESRRFPTEGVNRPWEFAKQWEWNGTQDWAPLMSIAPAVEFRRSIGGEERIMEYNHSLAMEGGKRISKRWGTELMENEDPKDGVLTACMVNVALPDFPPAKSVEEEFELRKYFEQGLLDENVFAPPYLHAGKWWTRFSCQVWNELSDFDRTAEVFEKLCEGVRQGKHLDIHVAPTDTLHEVGDLASQADI
ncbi:pyridoxal phosphate-dependent transferase [Kockovaella imperatae]|uniref:Pyridoxal phosphate-dependent transferase n=1 Tax=Kockovaella imperatae TaxID=4999 RepID=A0A1Y1UTV6_9TREE|nr:pyridoxal phosphate-dependent transferase [Kockovaella imperatae]ORX40856.1 pyridoxal phosphate-dependent transferase [Kockovaella imperatae]